MKSAHLNTIWESRAVVSKYRLETSRVLWDPFCGPEWQNNFHNIKMLFILHIVTPTLECWETRSKFFILGIYLDYICKLSMVRLVLCVLATRQKWCPPLPHVALKSYGWPSMCFPTQAGWNETSETNESGSPCPCPWPRPSHSSPEQPWEQPVDNGREGGWISESLLRREPPIQEPPHRDKKRQEINFLLCWITEPWGFICY